jgi:hypothetical protein
MIIYVGIPCIDGKPYAATVDSLLAEQLRCFKEGVYLLVDWEIGCSLIGHARNRIADRFLKTKESQVLVFVDSDMSWKPGTLLNLAKKQEDVIGATYRAKRDDDYFHVMEPVVPDGQFYRVHGLPGGFLKISRKAFETIKPNYYGESDGSAIGDYFPTGMIGGTLYGEDHGFCKLWRDVGGTVWLDPSINLRHHDGLKFYMGDAASWLRKKYDPFWSAAA